MVEVREQLQRHQASMQKDNVVLKNALRHNAQSMILVEEECQVKCLFDLSNMIDVFCIPKRKVESWTQNGKWQG